MRINEKCLTFFSWNLIAAIFCVSGFSEFWSTAMVFAACLLKFSLLDFFLLHKEKTGWSSKGWRLTIVFKITRRFAQSRTSLCFFVYLFWFAVFCLYCHSFASVFRKWWKNASRGKWKAKHSAGDWRCVSCFDLDFIVCLWRRFENWFERINWVWGRAQELLMAQPGTILPNT